jgi:hypothetical protein
VECQAFATLLLSLLGWTSLWLAFVENATAVFITGCVLLELAAFVLLLGLLKRQGNDLPGKSHPER